MVPLAPRVTSGLASNKTHEVGTIVAKCSVAYNQLLQVSTFTTESVDFVSSNTSGLHL